MTHITEREMAVKIAEEVSRHNGSTYYVGGYVRDFFSGKQGKDIDIEVHGISPKMLAQILENFGERIEIGESFGIFGLKGYSLDIAMPRKETNRGKGHKDFDICVDPFCGTYLAAKRRDFTVNALMQNVLTGEVIDHFSGKADLEKGIIRHVNDVSFAEDPLRVLRGAQFAARFNFTVAEQTVELCRRMDLSHLPKERIMGELEKALLKSEKPSVFFETLRQMNQLDVWFPELKHLIGVEQNPKYHSEGDVWTHTMMVLDAAVRFLPQVKNKTGFMLSALTHDFGKAVCTKVIDGVIHSYNHETLGLPLVEEFMQRLTGERRLTDYVMNMTQYHMKPNVLAAAEASVKSTNKMFDASVDPEGLICLATADGLGKITHGEYVSHVPFLEERLALYNEYMSRPYVMGRDLIAAGITPGENFAEYLSLAHKLRLAGVYKESALKQTLALARKKENSTCDFS